MLCNPIESHCTAIFSAEETYCKLKFENLPVTPFKVARSTYRVHW